ncbi:MAG: hypothetical protein ACM336_09240, partial [Acidobacteriota bacterium]
MIRARLFFAVVAAALAAGAMPGGFRAEGQTQPEPQAGAPVGSARDLFVTEGKSLVVESPVNIQRVSVGDAAKAEALAVTPRE